MFTREAFGSADVPGISGGSSETNPDGQQGRGPYGFQSIFLVHGWENSLALRLLRALVSGFVIPKLSIRRLAPDGCCGLCEIVGHPFLCGFCLIEMCARVWRGGVL